MSRKGFCDLSLDLGERHIYKQFNISLPTTLLCQATCFCFRELGNRWFFCRLQVWCKISLGPHWPVMIALVFYIPTCLVNLLVPLWARVDHMEFWEFEGDKTTSIFQLYGSFCLELITCGLYRFSLLLINHFVVIYGTFFVFMYNFSLATNIL